MSDPADTIRRFAQECASRGLTLKQARYVFEGLCIAHALARARGNVTNAANLLGVQREMLQRRLKISAEPGENANVRPRRDRAEVCA